MQFVVIIVAQAGAIISRIFNATLAYCPSKDTSYCNVVKSEVEIKLLNILNMQNQLSQEFMSYGQIYRTIVPF